MNEHNEIQEEKYIADAIKKLGVQKAPQDFKSDVMQVIMDLNDVENKVTVYEPLITQRGWLAIASIATLVLGGIYMLSSSLSVSDTYAQLVDKIPSLELPTMQLDIHPYFVLGIACALGFMTLQMPLLKKYYNRS